MEEAAFAVHSFMDHSSIEADPSFHVTFWERISFGKRDFDRKISPRCCFDVLCDRRRRGGSVAIVVILGQGSAVDEDLHCKAGAERKNSHGGVDDLEVSRVAGGKEEG